jgi:hypothetical protein
LIDDEAKESSHHSLVVNEMKQADAIELSDHRNQSRNGQSSEEQIKSVVASKKTN